MAPGVLLSPHPDILASSSSPKWNDWRDDLAANGYAVIEGAVSPEKAASYQQQALDWMSSFSDQVDLNNPATWTKENLPIQTRTNLLRGYGVEHEKFMWDARMEPGVVDKFEKIWGTDELLVSFDALNVTLPNRKDKPDLGAWEHVDQSPLKRGLHCVQGMINLSEAGPDDGGLLVYPGSHKLVDQFFENELDRALWKPDDFYMFTAEQLQWFQAHGCRPHKICAKPGDLILWDSRTIHQGCEPTASSKTIRTVIYVTYTPAKMADKDALELKAKVFNSWRGTTHWPHKIKINKGAVFEDGTKDPRDRDEPLHKPVLTTRLLRYAGVERY